MGSDYENNFENNLESCDLAKITKNKRLSNKIKRMNGMKYEGLSKGNVTCERMPRKMGETCKSNFCLKSSVRHCALFSEDTRREIFSLFWKMAWEQKKLYVINLIESSNRKRICAESSRRLNTKRYHLKLNTNRVQVCSKMFFSSLIPADCHNFYDSIPFEN